MRLCLTTRYRMCVVRRNRRSSAGAQLDKARHSSRPHPARRSRCRLDRHSGFRSRSARVRRLGPRSRRARSAGPADGTRFATAAIRPHTRWAGCRRISRIRNGGSGTPRRAWRAARCSGTHGMIGGYRRFSGSSRTPWLAYARRSAGMSSRCMRPGAMSRQACPLLLAILLVGRRGPAQQPYAPESPRGSADR